MQGPDTESRLRGARRFAGLQVFLRRRLSSYMVLLPASVRLRGRRPPPEQKHNEKRDALDEARRREDAVSRTG